MNVTNLLQQGNGTTLPSTRFQIIVTLDTYTLQKEMNLVDQRPLLGLVSAEVREMFRYIVDMWLCSIFSYIGIVVNIVAVIVFAKMGFEDTVNISLTCIAFWDIVKCLANAVMRVYGPLKLTSPAFAQTWYSFTLILVGYLYSISGYVSGAVAGYVAVERCLCVSLPFTVKILLTREVVTVVNVLISFIVVASYVIVYARNTFTWVYSPFYNQSVARIGFSKLDQTSPALYQYIQIIGIAYPILTFIIMCVCTIIIIYFLRKSSAVRSQNPTGTTKANSKKSTSRDKQVTKMLLVVIGAYIVTYIPRICYYIANYSVAEFNSYRRYKNLAWVIIYIMFLSDLINACLNPFILVYMSTQFRQTLKNMVRVKGFHQERKI